MNDKILPIVLSGGSGTRLWPLSRECLPKQYLQINETEKLSFLQNTIQRLKVFENIDSPIIICNEDHRFIVAEQMRDIKVKPKSILLEPIGRNTAPAITIAALKGMERGEDPILFVLPSDHLIKDLSKFKEIVKCAIKYAHLGKLITFGIVPNKPETGYGYIEAAKVINENEFDGEEILRFIEKPDLKEARKFIKDKRFSWNSGIFLFKSSTYIREIKKRYPNIYHFCKKSLSEKLLDLDFQRLEKKYFECCENISIDNAIMEKTDLGMVFPLDVGWNDIGSWRSMWEVSKKDKNENVLFGNVILRDVKGSYLRAENSLLVGIGIEDLVIVETSDAIIVSNKNQTQDLKSIVKKIGLEGKKEITTHKTIFRPWGHYTSISEDKYWQVKKIIVKPGHSLSLQLHKHRTEHWIVVSGKALVQIDDKEQIISQNESTYIPLKTKHRLSNPGEVELILIEVQSGNYLGEDDIVRFKDDYGRL